ncbi:MAG: dihydrofolate reductase [Bacteroidota bacterium]
MALVITAMSSCKPKDKAEAPKDNFKYLSEQFSDLKIMRYQVPGFDSLSLKQKELVYYLSQAALSGRDIIFDQNFRHNLCIRRTLENIFQTYKGKKEGKDWDEFVVYLKRVWFSNGVHHHYASDKFLPEFSQDYFKELIKNSDQSKFPLEKAETVEALQNKLIPVMFDPAVAAKKVNLDPENDLLLTSAVNFYEGVNQKEAKSFYEKMVNPNDSTPISYGLNSKLVKENGKIVEKVYKVGGLYGAALEKVVFWLEKAKAVAENPKQEHWLDLLIQYYKSGDLKLWDAYNIAWVEDLDSQVDVVNGFVEDYEDPLGRKATWESVVDFKDFEATKRSNIISGNAQWFEDNSPLEPQFKKKSVKGISAKVITTAQLGGGCYPTTPIGINLPNADWIRKDHGSKSVTMDNITYSYDQAALGNGFMEEFAASPEEIALAKQYGSLAGNLTTDLHECLGHASGQLAPGTSPSALENYQSTLEEARADLFALYYIMDQKLIDLKLIPSLDVAKAEYNNYMRNGLMTQLTRIKPGKNIEEAHMRNRALNANWVYEKGKKYNVVEMKVRDGKTYVVINDYNKLRALFGELLKDIQTIKSTGNYKAGKDLVENYGVKVDQKIHKEILARYEKLKIAPYGGFINPEFVLVEKDGKITDVKVTYPESYVDQMLKYSREFSFLPTYN